MNSDGSVYVRDDGNLIAALATSREVADVITTALEGWKRKNELASLIEKYRSDFENLSAGRFDEMTDRDKDRIAVNQVTSLLIAAEKYELATAVFNNFIDRRPRFSLEVADFILKHPHILNKNVT